MWGPAVSNVTDATTAHNHLDGGGPGNKFQMTLSLPIGVLFGATVKQCQQTKERIHVPTLPHFDTPI